MLMVMLLLVARLKVLLDHGHSVLALIALNLFQAVQVLMHVILMQMQL